MTASQPPTPDEIERWLGGDPPIDDVVDQLDATRKTRDRFETATALMSAWLRERLSVDEGDDPVAAHRGAEAF